MTSIMETDNATGATSTLQMVRAEIRGRELQRWMGGRRLQDTDHAMHCLLVECFGELAPAPYRVIMQQNGLTGVLYGYGPADADQLRAAADIFADPLEAGILPRASLDSKPMPTDWAADKRLGFEIRIRPIIRKGRGSGRHRDEQDAFQQIAEGYAKGEMPLTREEVYARWLAERMARDGAAQLSTEQTRLVAFQRVRSFRKRHARYVEGPDAVMRGNLTIGDPAAFATLLSRGIGRHRAYGYGMLLLRPALSSTGP